MSRNNRTAGNNWERENRKDLEMCGFINCKTSRNESRTRDAAKVDLVGTPGFNFQSKYKKGRVSYEQLLKEMPDEDAINVILHKMNKSSSGGKRFTTVGKYAILKYEDFLTLLKQIIECKK